MARLVRGQVLQLKDQEYLLAAAKALGTPWYKVILPSPVPNTLGVVIVAVTFDVPSFIFGEGVLIVYRSGRTGSHDQLGLPWPQCPADHGFTQYRLFFQHFFIALTMLSFQLLGRRPAGMRWIEAETVMIQGKKGEQNE